MQVTRRRSIRPQIDLDERLVAFVVGYVDHQWLGAGRSCNSHRPP